MRLQDLARRFERSAALSFRAFVQHIEAQSAAEQGDAETPLMEEGSGGVRLMSVHKAKGLEFPIVILCDVSCSIPRSATRLTDRAHGLFAARICECTPIELRDRQAVELEHERAEATRLLYVAATRARDILAIPTLPESSPFDSWLAPFERALTEPNPGDHHITRWNTIRPTDPPAEAKPLRHWELISQNGSAYAQSVARFRAWLTGRDEAIAQGSRVCCSVQAATNLAHDSTIFTPELIQSAQTIRIERMRGFSSAKREGPEAIRFGALIHSILERIDLRADESEIVRTAALCARISGASSSEAHHATTLVTEALEHPLLQRARSGTNLQREAPVSLRIDLPGEAPILVEGIIDLVVETADSLFVVDYKTDSNPSVEQLQAYRRQVALYCMSLTRALNRPVEGYLLFV